MALDGEQLKAFGGESAGTGLGLATQIFSKNINNYLDYKWNPYFQKQQLKFIKDQNKIARDNAINSARYKVTALQNAGLNPALAGGEAETSVTPPASTPVTQGSPLSSLGEMAQYITTLESLRGLRAENELKELEVKDKKTKNSTTDGVLKQLGFNPSDFGIENFTSSAFEVLNSKQTYQSGDLDLRLKRKMNANLEKIEDMKSNPEFMAAFEKNMYAELEASSISNEKMREEIKNIESQITNREMDNKLKQSEIVLNGIKYKHIQSDIRLKDQQVIDMWIRQDQEQQKIDLLARDQKNKDARTASDLETAELNRQGSFWLYSNEFDNAMSEGKYDEAVRAFCKALFNLPGHLIGGFLQMLK